MTPQYFCPWETIEVNGSSAIFDRRLTRRNWWDFIVKIELFVLTCARATLRRYLKDMIALFRLNGGLYPTPAPGEKHRIPGRPWLPWLPRHPLRGWNRVPGWGRQLFRGSRGAVAIFQFLRFLRSNGFGFELFRLSEKLNFFWIVWIYFEQNLLVTLSIKLSKLLIVILYLFLWFEIFPLTFGTAPGRKA